MQNFIYLASSSPRRFELLTLMSVPFERLLPNVEEKRASHESPVEYVVRLAKDKAQAGVAIAPENHPVLGADTIVVLDDAILEKPKDASHATDMLASLSGRWHKVITAIALADRTKVITKYIITDVQFSALTEHDIAAYIATGEPFDKAGAYGIQGYGGCFVRAINGSYHNVVGLPLVETKELITTFLTENNS